MMENQQLIKKDRSANSYSKIFPWTFTDLVLDRVTKESLDNILVRNNFIALPYVGSKAATRLQVPMKNRRRGIWLSYIDYAGTLTVEYYNDNNLDDNHWQDSSYWLPYNTAEFQPASVGLSALAQEVFDWINSQITAAVKLNPEDLQKNSSGQIEEANRAYDTSTFSGLGYRILRKNIQSNKNILTQSMINMPNNVYKIRYDFDLNGATINLPANSVLQFEGGSIKNGTVVFNNTILKYKNSYIFDDIDISGNVCNDLYLSMWKIDNTIDVAPIIEQGLYSLSGYRFNIDIDCYISSYASIPSNSDLYINHDITITSSGDGGFTLMNRGSSAYKYSGASNIIVHGEGTFDFNSRNTNSSTNSAFTIYHCSNVIIDGITFKDPASYHVIEIGGSEHITIKNCKFFGFRPIANEALPELAIKGECIQIEHTKSGNGGIPVPYFDKVECRDIIIKDNLFDGLYTYDSNGNKVYSTYMWRPIGSHEDHVDNDADLTYHDGLLIEGNTFNSIRQVCITPRYINNCSIINNKATDLQGMFVSGLPVSQTFYNISFDFNNVRIIGNVVKFDKNVTVNTLVSSVYTVGRNNWGAIDLIGSYGNVIIDNEIYDAPNSSIILNCCPNTLIINNKFYGWNTIDKNKGVASNNRAAIDIVDDTPVEGNNQVKEITQYISMSGNLFVDNWTEFPIRPFTRNKLEIEDSWNIIDNVFNISNPAWRFIPPTTVNALDITSFGSVLVDNHPVWNKGFIGKSFTRSTGKNIYFNGKQWLNEDGTFIYVVTLVSDINDFTKTNHIYKIVDFIDLQGATLTIPANCTLDFQGGSFSNGTIIFNSTTLQGNIKINAAVDGNIISANVKPSWFGALEDGKTDDSNSLMYSIKIAKNSNLPVLITGKLYVTKTIDVSGVKIIGSFTPNGGVTYYTGARVGNIGFDFMKNINQGATITFKEMIKDRYQGSCIVSDVANPILKVNKTTNSNIGFNLENIGIIGWLRNAEQVGLKCEYNPELNYLIGNHKFKNILVSDCGNNGVEIQSLEEAIIDNCSFTCNNGYGLYIKGIDTLDTPTEYCQFNNCSFSYNRLDGVCIEDSFRKQVKFYKCLFQMPGQYELGEVNDTYGNRTIPDDQSLIIAGLKILNGALVGTNNRITNGLILDNNYGELIVKAFHLQLSEGSKVLNNLVIKDNYFIKLSSSVNSLMLYLQANYMQNPYVWNNQASVNTMYRILNSPEIVQVNADNLFLKAIPSSSKLSNAFFRKADVTDLLNYHDVGQSYNTAIEGSSTVTIDLASKLMKTYYPDAGSSKIMFTLLIGYFRNNAPVGTNPVFDIVVITRESATSYIMKNLTNNISSLAIETSTGNITLTCPSYNIVRVQRLDFINLYV